MFLPSIAFAAFLAVAANAHGDGSVTLQPNDKGIEDKQHGLLNHFLRKNKRELGRGRKQPPFIADSSSPDVEVPSHDCSYTNRAKSFDFDGDILKVDWNKLHENLSPSTEIEHVTIQDFLDNCTDELSIPYPFRTNNHLQVSDLEFNSGQSSPLCMASLFCAFKGCNPNPDQEDESLTQQVTIGFGFNANFQTLVLGFILGFIPQDLLPRWSDVPGDAIDNPLGNFNPNFSYAEFPAYKWVANQTNPSSNLPVKAIFPQSSKDVVAAVNFAREYGIKISTKNSGHDYAGRSTKQNTLLLNMNKYPTYSSDIVICDKNDYKEYPRGDPCRLTKARGKPAYLRYGGGENFAQMYENVRKYNEDNGYQFTAFGGGAATVSAMGYSLFGGLSGTTGGRERGFGLDQILGIEMVLASGDHVRFGPTKWDRIKPPNPKIPWEDKKIKSPKIYPQTKEVSGECFVNDEWGECDCDIPFELLWKTVRGGGPGYGVVLSFYLQLHEYRTYEIATLANPSISGCGTSVNFRSVRSNFFIAYYMQDEDYFDQQDAEFSGTENYTSYGGIDFATRTACSTPAASVGAALCDGEGTADQFITTYQKFVGNWNVARANATGITLDSAEEQLLVGCAADITREDVRAWIDLNERSGGGKPNRYNPAVTPEPTILDYDPSQFCIDNFNNASTRCLAAEADAPDMVPPSYILAPVFIPYEKAQDAFDKYGFEISYASFGPGTWNGGDGMDSLSPAFRNAGFWTGLFLTDDFAAVGPVYNDAFFAGAFQDLYGEPKTDSSTGNFILPAYVNPMHATPTTYGPLKTDITKACPADMPKSERDEKCFSLVEAIFGTEGLQVLTAAKTVIDPSNIFSCDYCVRALPDKLHETVIGADKCSKHGNQDVTLSDLPWNDLKESLDDQTSLRDTGPINYINECVPEFDKPFPERLNLELVDKESGVCTTMLFSAFEASDPDPDSDSDTYSDRIEDLLVLDGNFRYSTMPAEYQEWVGDIENQRYNIPEKVLHPRVPSDVFHAVKFANKHDIPVSVKNSGHSFSSSSTKAHSLLLNMRRYQEDLLDVELCDPLAEYIDKDDLSGQPCRVAVFRDKPGVIRVSGGRNWGEVYTAVQQYNLGLDNFQLHVLGGNAASVAPVGYSMQGGLSGTNAGRLFGFGADQFVQLEMILPTGQHVRFGPTNWEKVEGFDIPKTTEVTGVCNVKADEGGEDWQMCSDDIPFMRLWKAARGGAGGWGVVLSVYLQLHNYPGPLEPISFEPGSTCPNKDEFLLKYFLDSEQFFNITEDESSKCGTTIPYSENRATAWCFGEGSGRRFLDRYLDFAESRGNRELAEQCTFSFDFSFPDYLTAGLVLGATDLPEPTLNNLDGYEPISGGDGIAGQGNLINAVIPKKWIVDNIDQAIELRFVPVYMAFGSQATKAASDQVDSVSQAYRDGGNMLWLNEIGKAGFSPTVETFMEVFPDMYDLSDNTKLPSYIGSNHYKDFGKGPKRGTHWKEACPTNLTRDQRDVQCISIQESVWGTELYSELVETKYLVDPKGLFTCNACVSDDVCPWCNKLWTNNGEYVKCVIETLESLDMSLAEKKRRIVEAAQSDCGKPKCARKAGKS